MFVCSDPRKFARAFLVPALALTLAGCQSATTSTGPSPIKCELAISSPGGFGAAGGAGSVTVTAAPECAWTASTGENWISSLAPASGQGGAEIRFQLAPNQSSVARQGAITLGDVVARIGQFGATCTFNLSQRSAAVGPAGGTGTVTVATLAGCEWIVTNNVPWLSITSGTNGAGSGAVIFSAVANSSGAARVGTFAIAGQTFTVTQEAPGPPGAQCVYSIQPSAQAAAAGGGSAVVAVTAPAQCSWTAASNESWLAIVGPPTGAGSSSIAVSVAANTGSARTGTLTIAGQTFTVTQAGSCAASISPASASISAVGGAGPAVTVSTAAGCAWTAVASDPWLTITSAPSGTGNASVTFAATANAGSARTGTLNIAGRAFTVTQAGSCAASITPASASMSAVGGAGPAVTVSTAAGCAWTAVASDPWLTITSAASGTGNASVAFAATANAGSARTGTLTIAGQTFTVTQAGSCAASITPTTASMDAVGGAGPAVTVSTAAGCAWTAVASDPWLTITSAPSGTGNGTVAFAATANAGSARAGTLTIAGQTFTVTQAAAATVTCAYAIDRDQDAFGVAGGTSEPVTVTTTAGCNWTAVSNDAWITVRTGATGLGSGTVTISVERNRSDSQRQGTLTIAGQTFRVTQEAR